MENVYIIKDDPKSVWAMYKNINIAESWTGRLVSFGVLFSKWSDFVCYRNSDQMATADTGQVFFINLRLLSGFYNLPVGVEIVAVNEQERFIRITSYNVCYTKLLWLIKVHQGPTGQRDKSTNFPDPGHTGMEIEITDTLVKTGFTIGNRVRGCGTIPIVPAAQG